MTTDTPSLSTATIRLSVASSSSRTRREAELWALLVAVPLIAVAVAVGVAVSPSSPFGLLLGPGAGMIVGVALGIVAFLVAIRMGAMRRAALAVALVALSIRLPAVAAVTEPLYAWTYKHLGVVEYIAATGTATPTSVDIYSGWPAFFAAFAWVHSATGVAVIDIAQWFPLVVDLAAAAAMYALARALPIGRAASLTAALIAILVDWIAQDYFSPQAVSFVLGLVVLALLLHSRTRPVYGWVAIPVFAAILMTHQLTPFWLVLVTLLLGVVGAIHPRWMGLLFGAMTVGYVLLHLDSLGSQQVVNTAGPLDVASQAVATVASGSTELLATTVAARLVVGAVGLLSVLALVLAWRRGGRRRIQARTAAVLAFSPWLLLTVQSYGGEGLLRAYLYSIPGMALLLAPAALDALRRMAPLRGRRLLVPVAAAAVTLVVVVASLHALYGAWRTQTMSTAAVDVTEHALATVPDDAYLLSPAPGAPSRVDGDYVDHVLVDPGFDASMSTWAGWARSDFADAGWLEGIENGMGSTGRPLYILLTDGMTADSDYNGVYPSGALARFHDDLRADPDWKVVYGSGDDELFEYAPVVG